MSNPTNKPTQPAPRHVKPSTKKAGSTSFNLAFTDTKITLMVVLFLMMVLIGIVNSKALNTTTIIVFVVAELLSAMIPEIRKEK